jgi:hypothetical protein
MSPGTYIHMYHCHQGEQCVIRGYVYVCMYKQYYVYVCMYVHVYAQGEAPSERAEPDRAVGGLQLRVFEPRVPCVVVRVPGK